MTVRNLNNASVEVWISDPWDLGAECEDGPLGARIVRQSGEKISMRFEKSFHYAGKEIVGAVAQPRYVKETLRHLTKRGELVVGLLLITDAPEAVSIFEMKKKDITAVGSIHMEQRYLQSPTEQGPRVHSPDYLQGMRLRERHRGLRVVKPQ